MTASKKCLGDEINLFVRHVDSLLDALSTSMMILQEWHKIASKDMSAFQDKYCSIIEKAGDRKLVRIPPGRHEEWKELDRDLDRSGLATVLFPRSILVSLVSQFDAYIGRLLQAIFRLRPETLADSSRSVSCKEIFTYSSLDDVRDYIVEKEVEGILRESHPDQIESIEKKFGLKLREDKEVWHRFVEVTERRNLFVHADGIVSSNYINNCRSNGVELGAEIRTGVCLGVPQKYFGTAHMALFDLGVKLGHILWRKLFPNERETADTHLSNTAYDLLAQKRYGLARSLLEFACNTIKKHASEETRLRFVINLSQTYRWLGNKEKSIELLKAEDWTAKSDVFKLAESVLNERWADAIRLMRQIGTHQAVGKDYYRQWPLFRDFRERPEFVAAFREIFGEELVVPETEPVSGEPRQPDCAQALPVTPEGTPPDTALNATGADAPAR